MDRQIINFKADEQALTRIGGECHYSSQKVSYIEAHFDLGTNWGGFDSVRAIWYTDFVKGIATVLDSDGVCIVPAEVLKRKAKVTVNLVGSIVENDTLTDRLTTYPVTAVIVDADARVDGTETGPITASQFDQYVAIVHEEVAEVTGMTAEATTLPAGSDATASYSDGVLSFGIPRGEKGEAGQDGRDGRDGRDGEDGNGIESAVLNSDYTLTLNFTDGTSYTTTSIRGAEGNGIRSITKTGTSGLVDTYTITFDDGTTTTFTVTNGEKGDRGDTGLTPSFSIGTVETLEPNEQATATITGTDENPVLNLGIPQGKDGEVPDLESILPVDTASGDIASFPDGSELVPARSVKVELTPIQSGSGTPSPDNVRPISGHTECVTEVCGVNVWDEEWEIGYYDASGNPVASTAQIRSKHLISVVPNTQYYSKTNAHRFCYYDVNGNFISRSDLFSVNQRLFTVPPDCYYIKFHADYTGTYNHDISINYPSTDTEYHAYQGNTYTTDLGRTVYGGTLDVVSGELTDSMGYIASYNGETIGEPWISDRDEYVAGTIPSIGAEVVYTLATPQSYQLTPTEIDLLHGTNNLWSDGEIEVEYNADIQLYIDKKLG